MLTKRTLIVALVGLNLALLVALLLRLEILPSAHAAPSGRPGDFAACTAKIHEDYDALFVVDQTNRKLHMFVPNAKMDGTLNLIQTRELESDFQRTN